MPEHSTAARIRELDTDTARINAETDRLIAKRARSRARERAVAQWLHRRAWVLVVAASAVIAAVWATGFERWFALHPLLVASATITLLVAVMDWMDRGQLSKPARTNLIVGAVAVVAAMVLGSLS